MVLLALVLVVLMIFAAFSVDIGTAYAQRRQNQGTVDTAALSGATYFLHGGGNSGNFVKLIEDVKARAADDMGSKVTDADWASCADSGALAISSTTFSATEGSPCISFERSADTNTLRMRVRLPDVSNATSFSGVIGIHKLTTHAVAEVDIGSPLNGAFPAFVLSSATAGSVVCVLNSSNGQTGPCSTSHGGQFGTFQPWYYAPAAGCVEGNQGSGNYYSQAPAIALGLDHLLSAYPKDESPGWADLRMNGGNGCTVLGPNTVNNSTGFLNQTITMGLLTGYSGNKGPSYDGRLVGGPYSDGGNGTSSATMGGELIDNVPLWAFLVDPQPALSPLACKVASELSTTRNVTEAAIAQLDAGLTAGGGVPLYASPEALVGGCLKEWSDLKASGTEVGPIFDADFAKSRRAVSVPRFFENQLGNGVSTEYHIRDFVPLFLTGEFQKQNGGNGGGGSGGDPANSPALNHWAGDPINGSNNSVYNAWNPGDDKLIESEAAVFVPCGALPTTICKTNGVPGDDGFGGEVHGVTLTR